MDRALACRLGTFGAAVVVGTAASAIAAASLAPALPLLITGAAGTALASVAAGLFANDLGGIDALGDPDLRNGHLTQAVGEAIALVIAEVAAEWQKAGRDRKSCKEVHALKVAAGKDWEAINRELFNNEPPAALAETELAAQYFATAAQDFSKMQALDCWEEWRPVLDALQGKAWRRQTMAGVACPMTKLTATDYDQLAQRLHEQFPKAIREVLKRDFAAGKEAFAGMVFDLLGNLTAGQQDLAQQLAQWRAATPSLSQALAEQLTADLQRLEGVVIEQGIETRNTVTEEGGKTRDTVTQEADRIISELKQPLPTPHSPLPPPTNLPQYRRTVPKFVGRDVAMDELTALVQDCETVAIAAAVSGMGGLGKTELAWQWADREYAAGNFPGGVVWLDLAAGNPGEQLVLFYQTEFKVEIPAELTEVGQRVDYCWRHWLRPGAVLVVLDDVVRERDGAKLAMFGPGGVFRVLWTTREEWSGVKRYPLDELSDEAARELLASYIDAARLEAEPEAVAGLLRWFGGLPLGLELAGRYLALDGFLTIADYLNELHLSHESLAQRPAEMTYPHGIEAALALSWGRLPSDAVRRLVLRFGLYGAAPIPLTPDEQKAWRAPLKHLVNLNLVKRDGADVVRLHPLVRQFVRSRLGVELTPEEGKVLKREVAGAIVAQGKRIPDSFTMEQAQDYAPWIPHLEEVAGELLPWVADEDVITPCTGIAQYHQGQGLYGAAEPWKVQCVEVARSRLGNQHPDTATALNNLAGLYESQGKYGEAEPLFLEALQIDRESLPPNHPQLATHLNNLAGLYQSQGKYGEAEPLYLEALEIDRESLPPNHPNLATHLNNLAGLYRAQGKYGEAEPLYLEALQIIRASLPPNHPDLATHLNNLAELYRAQGKYGEAEPLYLEALEIDRESLPPNHPDLATHLNNLAGLYKSQGKYGEAEPLYLESLSILIESQSVNLQAGWYNVIDFYQTALAAGLPDTRLRQHPLGDAIRSRL